MGNSTTKVTELTITIENCEDILNIAAAKYVRFRPENVKLFFEESF